MAKHIIPHQKGSSKGYCKNFLVPLLHFLKNYDILLNDGTGIVTGLADPIHVVSSKRKGATAGYAVAPFA